MVGIATVTLGGTDIDDEVAVHAVGGYVECALGTTIVVGGDFGRGDFLAVRILEHYLVARLWNDVAHVNARLVSHNGPFHCLTGAINGKVGKYLNIRVLVVGTISER